MIKFLLGLLFGGFFTTIFMAIFKVSGSGKEENKYKEIEGGGCKND